MSSAPGLLPSPLAPSQVPARLWLALAAAVGCGACGYAGLYPRFDDGSLRIVLGLTSAVFGAFVAGAAVSARTPSRAFGLSLLFAAILGVVSTVIPSAILTHGKPSETIFTVFFGSFFGAPTGVMYGIPLGILASCGQRYVHAKTHDATDRAARLGGFWLVAVAAIALATTLTFDRAQMDWASSTMKDATRIPAVLAVMAMAAGVATIVQSFVRQSARTQWLDGVRAGLVPKFRVRAADPRDCIEALPCLGGDPGAEGRTVASDVMREGVTVLEWLPDDITVASAGTAYRVSAAGRAVAVVTPRGAGPSCAGSRA